MERLRVFIGQGLLLALQALILLAGTLIILLLTNARLTLVVLPILPLALLIFMGFGAIAQPLFVAVSYTHLDVYKRQGYAHRPHDHSAL